MSRLSPLALPFAAVTIAASLALAGCTSPGTNGPAEPTPISSAPAVEPADGDTISGTGYSFAVPEGWGDPGPIEGFDADSLAADLDDADGFADNVNVILSPAGKVELDQVESAGPGELEGGGATDVSVEPRVTVAGEEAAHISANLASGDTSYLIEQFYVNSDDQTFIVTFSFSPDVADVDRQAVTDAVLASWAWS
ncbi:MAG: hypothetical protein P0Y48_13940 [Candidatus Microbacterium phytovorans]|uniref:Lipoprotein n=1 Tax=Candidatus Microbacterium phytovorans TaxID=3121374 RepID=A0AAJ5W0B1_9MICO|nr:hypothetical protein [Microbacterium sp.]WEK13539.1 MAG: hypothetical protein P0Y48_13940 [Microbacterium sp.]